MSDKYEFYFAEDFLQDDWFRQWLVGENPEAEEFWKSWMEAHPEKQSELIRAQALFRALGSTPRNLTAQEIDQSIDETVARIHRTDNEGIGRRFLYWRSWFSYAASILIVAGITVAVVKLRSGGKHTSLDSPEKELRVWEKKANTGSKPMIVQLPDGSRVTLQPQAILTFRHDFEEKERRTFLVGNAFFEVARNPEKPFYVVTNSLITKVLGTSFWVRSGSKEEKTSVVVRTGKVSVFKRAVSAGERQAEIILTPNQRVEFSGGNDQLSRALAESPAIIHVPDQGILRYEDTPITKVFQDLETTYGIKIVYDNELLRKCQLTATFGQEPFFEKLELICQSVRASYRQKEGTILIDSKGCNY